MASDYLGRGVVMILTTKNRIKNNNHRDKSTNKLIVIIMGILVVENR